MVGPVGWWGQSDGGASPVWLDQTVATGMAVRLQNAREALRDVISILPAAPRRIGEGHARRGRATPWAIIARQGPEGSGFGFSRLRIKNGGPRFIHQQFGGLLYISNQRIEHRLQLIGGLADPGREGGAVQINTLAGVNIRMAGKRQMIGVFGHRHMRDRCLDRHAARDQARGRTRHFS